MRRITWTAVCFLTTVAAIVQADPKPMRLPAVDLHQPIIWGSEAELPDGGGVAFGGQDQHAEDGRVLTRVKRDGKWVAISSELREKNPRQAECDKIRSDIGKLQPLAEARAILFHRLPYAISVESLRAVRNSRETEAETIDCEPAARALSPLVYEAKTKVIVMFGGDHLDYLTNDTWRFDPVKLRWDRSKAKNVPPPRANHKLVARGDGTVVMSGGYRYASNTDYMGGQYLPIEDGEWVYDIAKDEWTPPKEGKLVAANQREYRTGPFLPEYFMQGPVPDAAAFAKSLEDLPPNTWRKITPQQLPQMNRDWGTAVLDPDHDLILRWSGGHCAHGGSDVLHYHLKTGRWELPFPVEFPLGQLYTNTEYPMGRNFNGRPWVTAHTYQSYAYDPIVKKMLFVGERDYTYVYDVDRGDWGERIKKPEGMNYDSCYYSLELTVTPKGTVCWTVDGRLFRFDAAAKQWVELKFEGKLPGSVVDSSTLCYDPKRDRLLFAQIDYGHSHEYDGQLHELDLKTMKVREVSPAKANTRTIPYIGRMVYHPASDLMLVGAAMIGGGERRTLAWDGAAGKWVSVKCAGDDPFMKEGRNVSLGIVYDAKRKLFWAVDTHGYIYVMKFDPASADIQSLK
jgi:hypothetical protein